MYLQPQSNGFAPANIQQQHERRADDLPKRQNMARNTALAGIAVLAVAVMAVVICLTWRMYGGNKNKNKTKKATWFGFGSRGGSYEQANSLNDFDENTSGRRRRTTVRFVTGAGSGASQTTPGSGTTAAGVDRHASVRSVMTLPAYREDAGDTEQVLGREGERDGVDVVVELPTEQDEEEMRENEMAALYELRLARRDQIAEREQRRVERRDARARGDNAALRAIQERTRVASNSTTLDERRAEHERLKAERQRAVSSVSYGDLGVARHDGTRIRAASVESERVGLLSDAASIAATSTHSGAPHQRHASQASILSMDSDASPGYRRSNDTSRPHTPYLNTNMSSPDLADDTPAHSPPGYDDVSLDDRPGTAATTTTPPNEPPPDYPGPAAQRASRIAAEMSTAAASERRGSNSGSEHESPRRSASGAPQLPEIQVTPLPRIVVEPSSARP
ncbi:hypothetical protein F5X68DRAFT_62289 [Plectosphaerella plurivora]|uniref:Uncharacterized protein n=1 Tax=Plectosphaerella plurivora TaxID=936078 RepID=A0A9P8V1L2_9PEZI|nr:hypothetical protein F5X68DRAFT_62289 [Plectosphaerella plurivora]